MDRATLHQFWHFVDTDSYEKVRTLITRFCPDVTSRFPFRSSAGQQSGTGASPYFRSVMRPVRNRQLHFARAVVEQRRGTGSITVHRSSGGAAVELWQINNSCPTEMGVPKTTGFATPCGRFGFSRAFLRWFSAAPAVITWARLPKDDCLPIPVSE